MIQPELKDFLIAIIGAAASFIGLLFVAMSFAMNDNNDSKSLITTKRILAESSYGALICIFFIGLVALIPNTTIGYVSVITAWIGLGTAVHYWRVTKSTGSAVHNFATLAFSIIVYALQIVFGVYLLFQNNKYYVNNYVFMTLVILLFTTALTRAWELTGIHNYRQRGSSSKI